MLPTHQRVRKGVFFEMSMGSISPGPRMHIILFFKKSCDFVDVHANNQAVSKLDINDNNDNNNNNDGATAPPPPPPPQLDGNNDSNDGWATDSEKGPKRSRIIWALCEYLFFIFRVFFLYLLIYIGATGHLKALRGS